MNIPRAPGGGGGGWRVGGWEWGGPMRTHRLLFFLRHYPTFQAKGFTSSAFLIPEDKSLNCGTPAEGGLFKTENIETCHATCSKWVAPIQLTTGCRPLFVNCFSLPSCYLKSTFQFCDICVANILPGITNVSVHPVLFLRYVSTLFSLKGFRAIQFSIAQPGLWRYVIPSKLFPLKLFH